MFGSNCTPELRKYVDDIFKNNKLVFVGVVGAIPCRRLRNELEKNMVEYQTIDVSRIEDENLFMCIYEKSGDLYFPQLFHHGKYIGNYFDSLRYINEGKLRDSYKKF